VGSVRRDGDTVKDLVAGGARGLHIGNDGVTHEEEMSIALIVVET